MACMACKAGRAGRAGMASKHGHLNCSQGRQGSQGRHAGRWEAGREAGRKEDNSIEQKKKTTSPVYKETRCAFPMLLFSEFGGHGF